MPTPTEFYRWFIIDERTGKRRRTTYAMTREEATERHPGADPDLQTREVRDLPEPGETRVNAKPLTETRPEPSLSSCAFCEGTGWVCADHPEAPWPHEGCGAEGAPCVCNPSGAVGWEKIYAETRHDDEPQH